MGEPSFFDGMIRQLRATCKYYTGYPKDLGPSRVIHFTSERQFVQLLHEGHPVVVAFTIKSNYTKHLDKVLEEASAEFSPQVKFMRVECPKYPGFCITRQRKEYPFIEIFHSPEQASNQGKAADPNITKYSVKVLPFNYDLSGYGFREFFKRHGIKSGLPDGQPKLLLCLIPNYPLLNFMLTTSIYIAISYRLFELTNTLKVAFVPSKDNKLLAQNIIAGIAISGILYTLSFIFLRVPQLLV